CIAMDQISDAKRGKKLKCKKKAEDVATDKNELKSKKAEAEEHEEQLKRLQETQAEFFEYTKEHDEELLKFDAAEFEDDVEADTDLEDTEKQGVEVAKKANEQKTITAAMIDSWCKSIREDGKLGAVRSILRAYRTACHYGDDTGDDPSAKLSVMSSAVFNKIMIYVLSEMDGILRKLLRLPATGGMKDTIMLLTNTRPWKNYNNLVKSYLGNSLHVLNQMTDPGMISFTLRRLKHSSVFLSAFPSLLRKYIKVALHFWGTGSSAISVVSLLFLRDLCIRLGNDCVDDCIKGMYKAYVLNCQFVNAHAFVFIRQLAMILREALNTKTKEAFRKVYQWKFIHCLELWTGAVCAYSSQSELRSVAYPLAQIISGVARLVPTARYIPLRLRCVSMLNRIAASTGSFIPVSMLLMDMLDMKELNRPPTGGVDLRTLLKVSKPAVKTRAFQEACVYSVVEELVEHLSQWSCSVAFFELSFREKDKNSTKSSFCSQTSIQAERFRKEMKQLISQVDANSEFVNRKRGSIDFQPNEPAASSFLENDKKAGESPLSQYAVIIRQRAKQRNEPLVESDVIVGEESAVFGKNAPSSEEEEDEADRNEKGAAAFSSSWLPGSDSKEKELEEEKTVKKKRKRKSKTEKKQDVEEGAGADDVVEDFVLSSDEEEKDDDLFDIEGDKDEDEYDDAEDEIAEPETKTSSDKKTKGTYKTWHKNYKKTKKKPRLAS
ncbi:hypothetical protein HID58_054703, partial [Brassica napus]